jgi:dienelactone hydrolase
MKYISLTIISLLLLQIANAQLQEQYSSDQHFASWYNKAERAYHFKGNKLDDFIQWRKLAKKQLKQRLGLLLLESSLPNYRPVSKLQSVENLPDFQRQHWVVWTEPTIPLPVIVLVPKTANQKWPLVVTPHGHGRSTVDYAGIYTDSVQQEYVESTDRNIAVQAVREGYIAIVPTTRGFGATRASVDIPRDKPFSCRIQLMHDLLIGRTPIGDRVWDISRILDWALQEFPIDTAKIAITGNSAGGTTSLFAAAVDERIKVAAPSAYFTVFTESIGRIEHCDCNYIPGILQDFECSDIAGMIAPRQVYLINGVEDEIYPIESARKAFQHLKQIYKAAGVENNALLYEGQGGHRYYKEGIWPYLHNLFNASQLP